MRIKNIIMSPGIAYFFIPFLLSFLLSKNIIHIDRNELLIVIFIISITRYSMYHFCIGKYYTCLISFNWCIRQILYILISLTVAILYIDRYANFVWIISIYLFFDSIFELIFMLLTPYKNEANDE